VTGHSILVVMSLITSLLVPPIELVVNEKRTLRFKTLTTDGVTAVRAQISAVSKRPQIATVEVSQVDLSVTITGLAVGIAPIVVDQVPPTQDGSLQLNVQITSGLPPPVKDLSCVVFVSADPPTAAK
jgi:hypothetical protein